MRGLVILFFVFAILPVGILGHDIYMAYMGLNPAASERMLSDIGWLWTKYEGSSYEWVKDNADPALWQDVIDPILEQTAVYVTAIPSILLLCVIVIMKIMNFLSGGAGLKMKMAASGNKKGFAFDKKGKGGKTKYKRK